MPEEKIVLRLLKGGVIIIAKPEGDKLIAACRVIPVPDGHMIIPMLMGISKERKKMFTINKDETIRGIEDSPTDNIVIAYKKLLSGDATPPSKLIKLKGMPSRHLN